MTTDVQGLRSDAELGLSDAVTRANDAMARIAQINRQLGTADSSDATTASLQDQRDQYIDQLAQLMDINVIQGDHNQVTLFTNSGIELVGIEASHLSFDAQGSMTASAQWSADPSQRTVGTLVLKGPNGGDVDLISNKSIRSGEIAAYLEMRDQVLVDAQAQLDEIAAAMARALSDRTVGGTAATSGAQSGFDIDLAGLLNGNSVRFSYRYRDNTRHTVDLGAGRRSGRTAAPRHRHHRPQRPRHRPRFLRRARLDREPARGRLPADAAAIFQSGGTTLRILDDGAPDTLNVDAVSATITSTALASGSAELPFFLDASAPYTGAITSMGAQSVGFAGASRSMPTSWPIRQLVVFATSPLTPAGDGTRPNFIYRPAPTARSSLSRRRRGSAPRRRRFRAHCRK